MIYLTQLIYLVEGQEHTFNEFEALAIPIISKYRGKLLLRVRPQNEHFIESHMEQPYEIHLVQFESQTDFELFLGDEERKNFLHLKEKSIRAAILIKGQKYT